MADRQTRAQDGDGREHLSLFLLADASGVQHDAADVYSLPQHNVHRSVRGVCRGDHVAIGSVRREEAEGTLAWYYAGVRFAGWSVCDDGERLDSGARGDVT